MVESRPPRALIYAASLDIPASAGDQCSYNATTNPRANPLATMPTWTFIPDASPKLKLFPGIELLVVPPSTPDAVPELVPPFPPPFPSSAPVLGSVPPPVPVLPAKVVGTKLVSVTIENISEPDTVATVVYIRVDGGLADVVVRIGPEVENGAEAEFLGSDIAFRRT